MSHRRLRIPTRRIISLVPALALLFPILALATPDFEAPFREYPADVEVIAMAPGDFDEDGLLDAVVSTASVGIDIVFMRQDADHSFAAAGNWGLTEMLQELVAGHFNADGHLDVAGFDLGGDLVVYFGNGNGGAQSTVIRPAPIGAGYLAVANLDGDGLDDLVAVSYMANELQTYTSLSGTLQPGTPYTTVANPSGLATGDLNADGRDDILLAHELVAVAEVLYSNGSGGVASAQNIAIGSQFGSAAAVADVNGDGFNDVLIGMSDGTGVAVARRTGPGTWSTPAYYGAVAGSANFVVQADDLDGDGDNDLVLGGPETLVLRNNGSGAFTAVGAALPAYVQRSTDLFLGDYDGDTIVDVLAYGNYGAGLIVARGNGDGTFGTERRLLETDFADGLAMADLDGDGDDDAVTVSAFTSGFEIYARTGDAFTLDGTIGVGEAPSGLARGRFDAGTAPDFATTVPATGRVVVIRGDGAGGFLTPITLTTGEYPIDVVAADLNSDGLDDLVVVCSSDGGAAATSALANHGFLIYRSTGSGFQAPTFIAAAGSCPMSVTVADVTGDGLLDLVAPLPCAGVVRVYPAVAPAVFGAGVNVASMTLPTAVAARDLDGDGDRDLVALGSDGWLVALPNSGGGTFGAAHIVATVVQGLRLVLADFDADGFSDVALASAAGVVAVHPGQAGVSFGPRLDFGITAYATGLVANDFDRDGDQDLLVPNGAMPALLYLHNTHTGASAVPDDRAPVIGRLDLRSPVPNPATGQTRLEFRLAAAAQVTVDVFDVRGCLVRRLVGASELPPGSHTAQWELTRDDGSPVPGGVYFARVRAGGETATQKIFVTR